MKPQLSTRTVISVLPGWAVRALTNNLSTTQAGREKPNITGGILCKNNYPNRLSSANPPM